MKAAVAATAVDGEPFELHLSTRLPGGFWTLEVRRPAQGASLPVPRCSAQGRISCCRAAGTRRCSRRTRARAAPTHVPAVGGGTRAAVDAGTRISSVTAFRSGTATCRIRGRSMYQTVFATQPGSAEMPSAGRPVHDGAGHPARVAGVQIAPLLLHTGVASLEDHEPPYEEYFRVPQRRGSAITAARRRGRRIVAVGTTVVRALETVTDRAA